MAGVDGEQLIDTDECDRDNRHLGTYGEKGGSIKEGLRLPVRGTCALREDENRHPCAQSLDSRGEAGERGAGISCVNGNLAGMVEVPADEGDLPKLSLGQD